MLFMLEFSFSRIHSSHRSRIDTVSTIKFVVLTLVQKKNTMKVRNWGIRTKIPDTVHYVKGSNFLAVLRTFGSRVSATCSPHLPSQRRIILTLVTTLKATKMIYGYCLYDGKFSCTQSAAVVLPVEKNLAVL